MSKLPRDHQPDNLPSADDDTIYYNPDVVTLLCKWCGRPVHICWDEVYRHKNGVKWCADIQHKAEPDDEGFFIPL